MRFKSASLFVRCRSFFRRQSGASILETMRIRSTKTAHVDTTAEERTHHVPNPTMTVRTATRLRAAAMYFMSRRLI
jgi:hypothetical protein